MICYLTLILISLKASNNCGKDFFVKWGKKVSILTLKPRTSVIRMTFYKWSVPENVNWNDNCVIFTIGFWYQLKLFLV